MSCGDQAISLDIDTFCVFRSVPAFQLDGEDQAQGVVLAGSRYA